MRFEVLGPLRVHGDDGAAAVVRPGTQTRVLEMLLSRAGRRVSAVALQEAAWPHGAPESADSTLRSVLSNVRKALGDPGRIVFQGSGYVLRVASGELDAVEFGDLIRRARDVRETGDLDGAADLLDRAFALWRGEPYGGAEEKPLLAHEIGRLTELRLTALEERAGLDLDRGRYTEVVPWLSPLADEHPERQRLTRLLMLALYGAGRPTRAIEAYRRLYETLRDRTGLGPAEDLREVQQAILNGTLELPVPPGGPQAAEGSRGGGSAIVPAQLPSGTLGFVGRDAELAQLDQLPAAADDERSNAVVISAVSGAAGVGKTALAVHWAHAIADRFPDGQLYVNLRGFDPTGTAMDPAEAVRGFLDALGVPADRIPVELAEQAGLYRSLLDGKRMLVVLDNARDTAQIRPLLPGTPGCAVIVTSRTSLGDLIAESGGRPIVLDLLSNVDAHRLLAERLGSQRLAEEPDATGEIIALCARLPLALAIVAARAALHPRFPLGAIAAELRDARLDALALERPDSGVRAAFSWSYTQLGADAQQVFRLLGLHPGPDISAAAVVSLTARPPDVVRRVLGELTGAHLLTEHVPGRYTFHDLLRTYATELAQRTDSPAERDAATRRLLDHYVHSADVAGRWLNPTRDPITIDSPAAGVVFEQMAGHKEAVGWFTTEYPVLPAILAHAASLPGFEAHVWELTRSLRNFQHQRGDLNDRARTAEVGLAAAKELADRATQVRAHQLVAEAYVWLGRLDDADPHIEQALHLLAELDDRMAEARIQGLRGQIRERRGDFAGALEDFRSTLPLYEAVSYVRGQAQMLNAIGWCLANLGCPGEALEPCRRALDLAREHGDRLTEADVLDSLGFASRRLGQYDEAIDWYQRSLETYRAIGDRYNEAHALVQLGHALKDTDQVHSARRAWEQALEILEQLEHPRAEAVRAELAAAH